jgi:YgiT-type zinc finger domain-containing protein
VDPIDIINASSMDYTFSKEINMKCSIQGCSGTYELKVIFHTVTHKHEFFAFENVPAEVCSVCGDILFNPDTIRKLDKLILHKTQPKKFIPVYEYS